MDKDIPGILEKFFRGECTPEERLILEEWYFSLGSQEDLLETMDPAQLAQLEDLVLAKINGAIDRYENNHAPGNARKKGSILKKLLYSACGIAALLALFFYFRFSFPNGIQQPRLGDLQADLTMDYLNSGSSIKKIVLIDSSIVWLSPKGKLKMLNNFDKGSREVFLDGLAFFEVKKDINRPFLVRSPKLMTKVWGTSFTVNAFSGAPGAKVSVLTGKVSVSMEKNGTSNDKRELMLGPEQQANYSVSSGELLGFTGSPSTDLDIWRRFELKFTNVKMSQVISKLNEKFHVRITVRDFRINDYLLIADLSNQNLPTILDLLKASMDISYEINGDRIILFLENK
jgi:transmembrane sensor